MNVQSKTAGLLGRPPELGKSLLKIDDEKDDMPQWHGPVLPYPSDLQFGFGATPAVFLHWNEKIQLMVSCVGLPLLILACRSLNLSLGG